MNMTLIAHYDQNSVHELCFGANIRSRSLISDELTEIIQFLLGNSLSVSDIQASKVNEVECIIHLIHIVEYLPRDVIVDLQHNI